MADQDLTTTEAFGFAESIDFNGTATSKSARDSFSFLEEALVEKGTFLYYPPFRVTIVNAEYQVTFGGNDGYGTPTNELFLNYTSTYPLIHATLLDVTGAPLDLTPYATIIFNVATDTGTWISRTCTVEGSALLGTVTFSWTTGAAPIGTHEGRFTCTTAGAAILSVPTWPVNVFVREL